MSRRSSALTLLFCFVVSLLLGSSVHADPVSSDFFTHVQTEVSRALRRREGVVIFWDRHSGERILFGDARVAGEKYRPGSVIKLAVAEEAVARSVQQKFRCTGRARIGGKMQFCWNRKGHGWMDLSRALASSCNLYFASFGDQLGVDGWRSILQRYQNIFGRDPGASNPDAFTLSRLLVGDAPEFRISPEQMAQFWESFLQRLQKSDSSQVLQQGMRRAVGEGTASRAGRGTAEFIGKTGTCDSESNVYKTDAWFVGAYPADEPRYAFVIFLKEAYGFREASALARQIIAATERYLP